MIIKLKDIKLTRATPDGGLVIHLRDGTELSYPNRKGRFNFNIVKD